MRTHRSCVCSGAVGSLQLEKCSDIVSLMDVTGGSQEKLVMTLIGVLLRGRGQELINLMDRCMGDAARTEEKPAVKKLVKVWLRLVQQDLSAAARNLNSFAPPTKPHRKVLAPAFFNFDSPWLVAPLQPLDGQSALLRCLPLVRSRSIDRHEFVCAQVPYQALPISTTVRKIYAWSWRASATARRALLSLFICRLPIVRLPVHLLQQSAVCGR
eukprot:GHVU01095156.1.p1 GENE.GHVU01095156.1~~GHVU01095156.1.p1  ORF type:complete len:213 (-),score=3.10 GHVU01095156.1:197-835(-)